MMKRYVLIEVDEDWGDNAVLDEAQALPCITRFHGPMGARDVREELEREGEAMTDEFEQKEARR